MGSRCSGGSGHFPPNPQAGGWRVAPQGTSGSSLSWCFIRGSHGSLQQGPGRAGQVRPHPDAAQGGRLVRAWPPSAVWSGTKAWEGASPGTCRSSGRQGGGRQGPRLSVASGRAGAARHTGAGVVLEHVLMRLNVPSGLSCSACVNQNFQRLRIHESLLNVGPHRLLFKTLLS